LNSDWRLAPGARVKLDKKSRRLTIYLVFKKIAEAYRPRGFISVDVNENHVAVLVDDKAYLFETGLETWS
jgi:putative transposase